MKTNLVQILASVFGVILIVALQDVLPKYMGVKPPLALSAALVAALYLSLPWVLGFSIALGLLIDTLAGLPPFCATGYLPLFSLAAHLLVRTADLSPILLGSGICGLATVGANFWLSLVGVPCNYGILLRACVALPLGLLMGIVSFVVLPRLAYHIGLGDEKVSKVS